MNFLNDIQKLLTQLNIYAKVFIDAKLWGLFLSWLSAQQRRCNSRFKQDVIRQFVQKLLTYSEYAKVLDAKLWGLFLLLWFSVRQTWCNSQFKLVVIRRFIDRTNVVFPFFRLEILKSVNTCDSESGCGTPNLRQKRVQDEISLYSLNTETKKCRHLHKNFTQSVMNKS